MPVQDSTDYLTNHLEGYAGQRVDLTLFNIDSKAAEGSDIPFGLAVVAGTSDDQCALPSAAGQRFLGISEYTSAGVVNNDDEHLYEENREVNIVTFGKIYVEAEVTVTTGDQVYYRHTAAGAEVAGSFRNDSDGGDAELVVGAIWSRGATVGTVAVIDLTPRGYELGAEETLTGTTDAVSVLTKVSLFDTTGGANAATLADGYEGQVKYLGMTVDGGTDAVVTPASFVNSDITFADVGDGATLLFTGGTWIAVGLAGAVVA